jgi:hypothetical protein
MERPRRTALHAGEQAKRNRLKHRQAGLRLDLGGNEDQLAHDHREQKHTGSPANV